MRLIRLIIVFIFLIGSLLFTRSHAQNVNSIPSLEYKTVDGLIPNFNAAISDSGYSSLSEETLNLGFYDGGVWLRFNSEDLKGYDLLEFGNPILDQALIFTKENDSLLFYDKIGDLFPFTDRKIKSHRPAFPVSSSFSHEEKVYVFITNRGEQFYLPVILKTKKQLSDSSEIEGGLFGGYFGILVFVLFFNLFIAIGLKDRNIYNYIFYIVGLIVLQLALSGYGMKWFWGDWIWFNIKSTVIFSSLSIFFLLRFARGFLSLKDFYPKLGKCLNTAEWLVFGNLVTALFVGESILKANILFINVITFFFGFLIIPISYLVYKNHLAQARFFLLAFLFLIFGVFAFVLRNLGLIPNNDFSEYGIQIGSSLEVILLTFAIIDKFKSFKDQALERLKELNEVREKANIELEKKVEERTRELSESNNQLIVQKSIIEDKNKEITDSIHYGQKIQQAILPPIESIKDSVVDAFVLFRPKDIVSGDFYWTTRTENHAFFVVADCTGHGVPGAFMSMIGNTLLNQIINIENEIEPDQILNKLRAGVIHSIKQKGEIGEQKDGMDLSLIRIDTNSKELVFAGANNHIYLVTQTQHEESDSLRIEDKNNIVNLYTLKADKQPIGYQSIADQPFSKLSLQLNSGDKIYMYTDGFPDQFGGEKGKKLKYKVFKSIILDSSNLFGEKQKQTLEKTFDDWLNYDSPLNLKQQTDDVCVLGLEV